GTRQERHEGGVPRAVGSHDLGTEVALTFPIAGGINRGAGVEVESEGGARRAVERAEDRGGGASGGRFEYGEVLQVVRAVIPVAQVVLGDTVREHRRRVVQVDAQAVVIVDRVPLDADARCGPGEARDRYPRPVRAAGSRVIERIVAVEGNHIRLDRT